MPDELLAAHSLNEAHCYLLVTPCPRCHAGPLSAEEITAEEVHIDTTLAFRCSCGSCDQAAVIRFRIDSQYAEIQEPPVINPTTSPSKLIDAAQWLTLYHTLLDRSTKAAEPQASRRLAYEAALCIEEALKFYDPDNDLPPDSAFFSAQTRGQARQHPVTFARPQLLDLRSKLPHEAASGGIRGPTSRRGWWRFWRHDRHT